MNIFVFLYMHIHILQPNWNFFFQSFLLNFFSILFYEYWYVYRYVYNLICSHICISAKLGCFPKSRLEIKVIYFRIKSYICFMYICSVYIHIHVPLYLNVFLNSSLYILIPWNLHYIYKCTYIRSIGDYLKKGCLNRPFRDDFCFWYFAKILEVDFSEVDFCKNTLIFSEVGPKVRLLGTLRNTKKRCCKGRF